MVIRVWLRFSIYLFIYLIIGVMLWYWTLGQPHLAAQPKKDKEEVDESE